MDHILTSSSRETSWSEASQGTVEGSCSTVALAVAAKSVCTE